MKKIMFATILLIMVFSFVQPSAAQNEVLNVQAVNLVKPEFPPAAKAVRASGEVKVKITVNQQGKVISAEAVSGHPLFKEACEKAALKSTFKSRKIKGKKVNYAGIVIYNFYVQ